MLAEYSFLSRNEESFLAFCLLFLVPPISIRLIIIYHVGLQFQPRIPHSFEEKKVKNCLHSCRHVPQLLKLGDGCRFRGVHSQPEPDSNRAWIGTREGLWIVRHYPRILCSCFCPAIVE